MSIITDPIKREWFEAERRDFVRRAWRARGQRRAYRAAGDCSQALTEARLQRSYMQRAAFRTELLTGRTISRFL